jgi:hypothetical protein
MTPEAKFVGSNGRNRSFNEGLDCGLYFAKREVASMNKHHVRCMKKHQAAQLSRLRNARSSDFCRYSPNLKSGYVDSTPRRTLRQQTTLLRYLLEALKVDDEHKW